MGPKPSQPHSGELFRPRLDEQLNMQHPLLRLAALIDWAEIERTFAVSFTSERGRPALPARLIAGLLYLQHTFNASDEAVVNTWVENPYWQFFCGETYLQTELPIDPSSLTRWRKRIGEEGVETCIVHLIRNSLDYASRKERKLLAAAIKPIYTAPSAEAAQAELDAFEQGAWGQKFPTVVAAWRRAWDRVTPFFAFPPAVRRVIYTTNAIESINAQLRKIIKSRGHFPSDDAATKLIWLALRNITADWGRAAHNWKEAMNQFAILYEERFTRAGSRLG